MIYRTFKRPNRVKNIIPGIALGISLIQPFYSDACGSYSGSGCNSAGSRVNCYSVGTQSCGGQETSTTTGTIGLSPGGQVIGVSVTYTTTKRTMKYCVSDQGRLSQCSNTDCDGKVTSTVYGTGNCPK